MHRTEGRREGHLGRGDEETLECSPAASLLLIEGLFVCISVSLPDMYVGRYAMNECVGTPSCNSGTALAMLMLLYLLLAQLPFSITSVLCRLARLTFPYVGLVRCGTKGPLFVSATDRKAFWLARAKARGHYTPKTIKEKKNKQVSFYHACVVSRVQYIG